MFFSCIWISAAKKKKILLFRHFPGSVHGRCCTAQASGHMQVFNCSLFRIWIRMFFGPLGSGSVIICTNPDLSVNNQKMKKTLISTVVHFCDFFITERVIFED
jgi:hypothetical protein